MNTAEHLQLIRARCVELLEIAEKRTAGTWVHFTDMGQIGDVSTEDGDAIAMTQERKEFANMADLRGNWRKEANRVRNCNATFIASCAGAAEAGWRATIATIDALQGYASLTEADNVSVRLIGQPAQDAINSIISAWPIELIK